MIRRKMKFGTAEVFRVGGVCGLFYSAAAVLTPFLGTATVPAVPFSMAALAAAFTAPVLIGIGIGVACMFIASTLKVKSEQAEKEQEREVARAQQVTLGRVPSVALDMQPVRAEEPAKGKSFVQDYLQRDANPSAGRQV